MKKPWFAFKDQPRYGEQVGWRVAGTGNGTTTYMPVYAGDKEAIELRGADAKGAEMKESKALLVEAFTHPQDSPQRLQVFSKFLKALRDENAGTQEQK